MVKNSSDPVSSRIHPNELTDRFAREVGLPASLAGLVLETARDVIEAEYPHLVDKVDALFADEARANEVIRWVAKLAAGARPRADVLDAGDEAYVSPELSRRRSR